MGRRFPGSGSAGSSGGGSIGEFNQVELFGINGTFTWTKPTNITGDRILVHVWGAGGCGGSATSSHAQSGGGGGGLAVKYIDVSALGASETLTIGAGSETISGKGGTSSFGSHCSATGGNSGSNNTDELGTSVTRPDVGTYYNGQGGIGTGGDRNAIGGWGGYGYYSSTSNAGGGGGGSAPAPYGYSPGFMGGAGYTYAGGGGAGIGGQGGAGDYPGGGGGGSAGPGHNSNATSYYTPPPGGPGINGPAGTPSIAQIGYVTYGGSSATSGRPGGGYAVIEPNQILFGGGGGAGGIGYVQSSGYNVAAPSPGGPGGGGGGMGTNTTTAYYDIAAPGGTLGGGGGANHYNTGGVGGNGAGGGGNGYGGVGYCGYGGDGLIIIQYKVI